MRKLTNNWIDEYVSYISAASESPRAYHFWCAASIVAATLKRHVWIDRKSYKLYPNMYVILVGHAGIGKGNAIVPATNMLKEAGTGNIIGDRVTIEYVLEKLSKGFPAVVQSNNGAVFGTDSSCLLAAPELQVFATASQHTLPILTDLWDCREHPWDYGTKTQGKYLIHKPTVSLLGGSTPSWLVESIPTSAVAGGFTRRVNFVYASDNLQKIPWPSSNGTKCFDDLVEDLREISQIQGEVVIEPQARPEFEAIYRASRANEFDNEATAAYKVSKWVHCIKLACVLSAGRDDKKIVSLVDLQRAATAVEEVQETVDLVFRAVGESDMAIASDRILRFLEVKGFAARNEILRANWRHVSHSDLDVILTTLMQAGLVKETTTGHKILYEAVQQPKVP